MSPLMTVGLGAVVGVVVAVGLVLVVVDTIVDAANRVLSVP